MAKRPEEHRAGVFRVLAKRDPETDEPIVELILVDSNADLEPFKLTAAETDYLINQLLTAKNELRAIKRSESRN